MREVNQTLRVSLVIIALSLRFLCGVCAAGELDGTVWSVFVPTIKDGSEDYDNTMPYSFTEIMHESESSSIQGLFEIFGSAKAQHDFHGTIKKVPDGYKFDFTVSDPNPDNEKAQFIGKLKPTSAGGYSPKGAFERSAVKLLSSKGAQIKWEIVDGIMKGKTGKEIPFTGKKSLRFTGFVIKPQ